MAKAKLTISLDAIAANWRSLDRLSSIASETAAVVKADGYGLGAARVSQALAKCGVRTFFVALAEEGSALRDSLGTGAEIFVLSGYLPGDGPLVAGFDLIPVINSVQQFSTFRADHPEQPFALQVDTGMNRLGMEQAEFRSIRGELSAAIPVLVMSHLACADEPDNTLNERQLREFADMTDGMPTRRSLSATGGMLLGRDYHFDLCRPGIGLYGGLPFARSRQVVQLSLPVIQVRDVEPGEIVGYGADWSARSHTRVATLSAGYADGIWRYLGRGLTLYAGDIPCKVVGRISMDLLTVDVSSLSSVPDSLQLLGQHQTIDELANNASTIGYEVLTSFGDRYERNYGID